MKILKIFLLSFLFLHKMGAVETPLSLPQPLPGHPRLLAGDSDWARINTTIRTDPVSARIFKSIRQKGDQFLSLSPVERTMTGRRLLSVSRTALERISELALLARVTGDERYARRAATEMIAAAKFTDWNPSHFLDVAEMSLALAIGYDWLYGYLSPEERNEIAHALLEKGIRPSIGPPEADFVRSTNNWNQVCNAGMVAAAIAIADREPAIAQKILERALKSLPLAAKSYAPDGVYEEGAMYWGYGTLFHVVLADSFRRFTGSTQGLDAFPGFAASADYIAQMTTPGGQLYAYSDSRPGRSLEIPLFWFARQFNRPDWISSDTAHVDQFMDRYDGVPSSPGDYRLLALALLWHEPPAKPSPKIPPPPLRWHGKGANPVVVFRSAPNDSQALYAAIKGGSPSLSHAHMDAGSFLIQSGGVTWATDLGMQEYESLEKLKISIWSRDQDGDRWKVFRLGPESHNILRFNGAPQLVKGTSEFVRTQMNGTQPFGILDLSPLYRDQVREARRGFMFVGDKAVLIQDEWKTAEKPVEIAWQFLTPAEVTTGADKILLRKDGKTMTLYLPDSAGIRVEVQDAAQLQQSYDSGNPGVRRITLKKQTKAGAAGVLRVLAVPESSGAVVLPVFQELDSWK